ncbi:hypothetical protein, partial [uncultured Phenylobacterium sp.]|uniref:hypothetical protein n=1 Tax=uncultured Phenylobacterium sp. TaxID=349273 RepID=UPI0025EE9D62
VQGPLSGLVTFGPGAAEAMLTVLIGGDTSPEDNETFLVTLGGGDFNNLTLSGVVMNDDLGAGAAPQAAAPSGLGSPVDMGGEPGWFLQNLTGGSLWGGVGGL